VGKNKNKAQLILMMKLKNKSITKKRHNITQTNPPNLLINSWDWDNLIENKLKQIVKLNSHSTQMLNDKIKKK
jgi:pyoverdine/dityrosine biosynthesis protein Dit1